MPFEQKCSRRFQKRSVSFSFPWAHVVIFAISCGNGTISLAPLRVSRSLGGFQERAPHSLAPRLCIPVEACIQPKYNTGNNPGIPCSWVGIHCRLGWDGSVGELARYRRDSCRWKLASTGEENENDCFAGFYGFLFPKVSADHVHFQGGMLKISSYGR